MGGGGTSEIVQLLASQYITASRPTRCRASSGNVIGNECFLIVSVQRWSCGDASFPRITVSGLGPCVNTSVRSPEPEVAQFPRNWIIRAAATASRPACSSFFTSVPFPASLRRRSSIPSLLPSPAMASAYAFMARSFLRPFSYTCPRRLPTAAVFVMFQAAVR